MIVILLVSLAILLVFSAFFSGSETALFSLSRITVRRLEQEDPHRGGIIARLLANSRRLLISLVIGNMLVNILSSTLAERLSADLFADTSLHWLFSTIVMTFLILILGEVAPKALAIYRKESFSLKVAPLIAVIDILVAPIRLVVRFVSDRLVLLLETRRPPIDTPLTKEELETAIHQGSREGTLNGEEKEMITEIFKLGDKNLRQLMTPRTEIVSFETDTPISEIAELIKEKEYSRIPVYSGKEENVIGIFYPKDLIMARARGNIRFRLGDLLRKPYFVPETMKASRLLRDFLKKKIHIALVVDEYGGISGLITLDDLVEEIVGEIRERGEPPPGHEVIDEDTIQIKGRVELDDLNQRFGLKLAGEENVTLGGYICEKLGHFPHPGEIIRRRGVEFEVITIKGRRVGQVLIKKKDIGATFCREDQD